MSDSVLLKVAEAAGECRVSKREMYYFLAAHPELVIELPGVRGKRVSRQRLVEFIERLNPVAASDNVREGVAA